MAVNHDQIPDEMKRLRQWCTYKLETVDGKKTKVPYEVSTGARASSTAPQTWTTFEAALTAYQDLDKYKGICFMCSDESGIVFIDLDGCIKDGTIEPWADEIVKRFNSYTERSQSGKGLHILIKGTKPGTKCRTKKYPHAVEIYSKARQCCTTGDVLDGYNTIESRQDELDKLYTEIFGKEEPKTPIKTTNKRGSLSDGAILLKATISKKGKEFTTLWNGSTLGYGGDESAADQALMNMLAFWTQKDPNQMERLFSQSKLGQRDKWRNRKDYREITIQKAIDGTTEIYKPKASARENRPSPDEFYKFGCIEGGKLADISEKERTEAKIALRLKIENDHGLLSEEDGVALSAGFRYGEKHNGEVDPEPYKSIDDQMKAAIAESKERAANRANIPDLIMEDVMDVEYPENGGGEVSTEFNHSKATDSILQKLPVAIGEDGQLYYWHGSIWQPNAESVIFNKIRALAHKEFGIFRHREVIAALRHELIFRPVKFDPSPYLLGVANGVVDLRTGEFREYKKEDYISRPIAVTYNPEAKCPRIIKFLEEVCPNITDRCMLVDWLALHAIGKAFPYILFLLGLGRNGKGVYEYILQSVFGKASFSFMGLDELNKSNFAKSNLYGRRGLIVSEVGDDNQRGKGHIPTRFLKLSTGDGTIDSDRKNTTRIQFDPTFKSTIDSNDMPIIKDTSRGWEERFCKADMPYHFVTDPDPDNPREKQRNPHLKAELTTDEELSGLLNLIIYRAIEICKTEKIIKRSGREYMAEYQVQSASVSVFLERYCEYYPIGPDGKEIKEGWRIDEIYEHYKNWCTQPLINGDVVDDGSFGKKVKKFCGGASGKREDINDKDGKRKQVRRYPGLMFFKENFDKDMKSLSTPVPPDTSRETSDKSISPPDTPDNYTIWTHIGEKFGIMINHDNQDEILSENFSIGENVKKTPLSGGTGADSDFTPLSLEVPGGQPESISILPGGNSTDNDSASKRGARQDCGKQREPSTTGESEPEEPPSGRIRGAAIVEYGQNGQVDPRKLALALKMPEDQIIIELSKLGYVPEERPGGRTVFRQRVSAPEVGQ